MKILKPRASLLFFLIGLLAHQGSVASDFVDFSPARKFIEVDVHALGGITTVNQNYKARFPQIQNLNVNLGASVGAGFRAVFGLREYLGFGTAIDMTSGRYNIDMAVLGTDAESMSAVFIDNTLWQVNIPMFVSFRFRVDRNVRWNVDVGAYYAYGFAGTQKQRIYRADINAMDEIVPQIERVRTDYYHSSSTFINTFNRGDIGFHFATYVDFGKHLVVGARFQAGIKNTSRSLGIINPTVRNLTFHGSVGYRF